MYLPPYCRRNAGDFRHSSDLPTIYGNRGFRVQRDRKSTRLNSSHQIISYAVFCLKKKKLRPFIHRTAIGMASARRCGGAGDRVVVPTLITLVGRPARCNAARVTQLLAPERLRAPL